MELNWSTFILEMINFLVLVWILKRFLYKPVLNAIAQRQAGIEKKLADIKTLQKDARKLQSQYEGRLAEWDQERQQARDTLSQEIETERARKLSELQIVLEQEKEKARVAEARYHADELRKVEEIALKNGARFATQLLQQAAGPDIETRLVDLAITRLSQQPTERIEMLRNHYGETPDSIVIKTAFPLADKQCQSLQHALTSLTGASIPVQFEQDSKLLAGIRITIGAWVLAANLHDELKGFVDLHYEE